MDRAICSSDFLHCDGRKIKNAAGQTIYLRGTNLGGWLLQEQWMAAIEGVDSQWEIVTTLEKRFSKEKADKLITAFEDNFITEYDLDSLKKAGFTCLRVPFWFGNLDFKRDESGKMNFRRLDWVTEQCGRRGMYVILDMHGVPGHQSIAHHSCRTNHCRLYDNTPGGERFRAQAAQLWQEIAEHFSGNPIVAAYDLMNEPMCDWSGHDKVDRQYWEVYNRLYRAVRSVDSEHIITLEAIWTPFDIPKPSVYGWENVIYQYHLYLPNNAAFSAFVPLEKLRRFNNPVLIGEFAPCRGKADWEHILQVFNKAGYNWCSWTYKGYSRWGDSSDWFTTGTAGNEVVVDLKNAEYEDILERWSENLRTEISCKPMADLALLGRYAAEK